MQAGGGECKIAPWMMTTMLIGDNCSVARILNSVVSKGRMCQYKRLQKGMVKFVCVELGRDQLQLSIYCEDAWGTDGRVSMCRQSLIEREH